MLYQTYLYDFSMEYLVAGNRGLNVKRNRRAKNLMIIEMQRTEFNICIVQKESESSKDEQIKSDHGGRK